MVDLAGLRVGSLRGRLGADSVDRPPSTGVERHVLAGNWLAALRALLPRLDRALRCVVSVRTKQLPKETHRSPSPIRRHSSWKARRAVSKLSGFELRSAPEVLLCEHLSQHTHHLRQGGWRDPANTLGQTDPVHGPELIQDDEPGLLLESTWQSEGIRTPTRRHRCHHERAQVSIELIRRDDETRPGPPDLPACRWVE
jgi:hypothetical protein